MNRLLLAILILSAGAFGFASLHQTTVQTTSKTMVNQAAWRTTTNRLATMNGDILALRNEVKDRKHHLQQLQAGLGNHLRLDDSSETGKTPGHHRSALADLREEWRMGWNDSRDYVLVDKQALKDINFQPVDLGNRVTDSGRALLAITPEEEAGVNQAIRRALAQHNDWVHAYLERTEPSGEIVAQYSIPADPASYLNISNEFSNDIVGLLGNERADIFLKPAWNTIQVASGSWENQSSALILRRNSARSSTLSYEWTSGLTSASHTIEPGIGLPQPFGAAFPNGWGDIARREGFGLSKDLKYLPNAQ